MPSLSNRRAPRSPWPVAASALADAVLIILFAAVGRSAHKRGDVVAGVLVTAWPFLAGAAIGWLASRAWRHPLKVRWTGVVIWLCSLVIGMFLRAITGQTAALPFVFVAFLSLGVLLLGYRLLTGLTAALRRKGNSALM